MGAKLACGATLSATRELAMSAGSATCALGGRYLFRELITPQICVIHLKSLAKIRQMCHKLSNFPLRFAISGAYSSKLTGDHSTINAKRGLERLFTYAPLEIFAESPLEEPIHFRREAHYEEHLEQNILPPRDY